MLSILLTCLLILVIFMSALWLLSLALKNASIVDIFWGPGFVLAAWVYFALTPEGYTPRKLLLLALVTVWGLRLGIYIGLRNIGKPEDARYRAWREAAGAKWWWLSYFQVFLLQGAIMWFIALPLAVAQYAPSPDSLTLLDILAVLVWGIGFFFETVGDWQLARFKGDPANKGKVMRSGLWRYTRHPNYFGDAVVWWGHFLLALSVPGGFLTVLSPAAMTYLLRRVSGVALLERSLTQTKPGYAEYIASTNAFFPGKPRN